MHGPRFSLLAAIGSAWALLVSSVSSLLAGASWPDVSASHVVEIAVALMASGFLFLVRKWIAKQEEADRAVMDTLRKHIEHQQGFDEKVTEFMGLVKGHLNLHSEDSDPAMQIRQGERRKQQDRRIVRPDGRQA